MSFDLSLKSLVEVRQMNPSKESVIQAEGSMFKGMSTGELGA
jgi:hypothetical protein